MKNTQTIPFFENKSFQQEFESILSFVSETCEVTNVFITQISFDTHSIIAKFGLDFMNNDIKSEQELFLYINYIIEQSKDSILSDEKIAAGFKLKNTNHFPFNFFTGIPILNSENLVMGTFCIMGTKSKKLSSIELKIAKNSAYQIQYILNLKEQNNLLQKLATHNKNQLLLYFENSRNISYELDLDGIFIYVSSNWLVLLGYESNEVEGRSFVNFIHIEDIKKYFSYINDEIKVKKSEEENEFRILHKKGHYLWFTSFGKLLIKKEGTAYVGTAREITDSVEIRNRILYQKEFYEKILDRIPTDVAVYDDGHRYVYLNPFAIKNDEIRKYIIGKDDFQYAKHTGKDNLIAKDRRAKFLQTIENKTLTEWEESLKTGNHISYHNRKFNPVFREDGTFEMMVGFGVDITEKKKLEDELRQSEEQFKGAFELSSIGMGLMNLDGNWKEVNDKLCDILGYSKDEFKSLSFKDITFGKDLNDELLLMKKLISGEIHNFNIEKRYVHKNKSLVWAFLSVALVRNNKGEAINFVSQIIDFSERKKVEKENKLLVEENNRNKTIQLNEAKNLYRLLADNTVNLVCLHNLNGTLQYVSPSVKSLLGYEPEDLVGKLPKNYMNPEDLGGHEINLFEFINGKSKGTQELRFKNSEGDFIWLEISATILEENGIPTGFQSNGRDITHQKEAKKIMEKALLKEKDLNELRTNLVSTISHEFRTPMTTIRTSAELIEMYMEGQEFETAKKIDKQLGTITGEIDRITELMNAVLTISKDDAGKTNFYPIIFDLKKLCLDVIETSFDNQKDGRKVQTLFNGINFNVFADKNLMEYSLFNLLNNAFKYSENSGDIILHITSDLSEIILEIIDFGIGIPIEDQHKLFNTFFRASNTNGIQGTGLGLYIVKTFTEKNFGKIRLESILNKGTKVTLQFPIKKQ
jgi:PAS domain S-box-containing protein